MFVSVLDAFYIDAVISVLVYGFDYYYYHHHHHYAYSGDEMVQD